MQQGKQEKVEKMLCLPGIEFKYIHHLDSDYVFPFTILSFNKNVYSSYK